MNLLPISIMLHLFDGELVVGEQNGKVFSWWKFHQRFIFINFTLDSIHFAHFRS